MKKLDLELSYKSKIIILIALCSLLVVIFIVCITANKSEKQNNIEPQAVNDIIDESEEVENTIISPRMAAVDIVEPTIEPYEIVALEIEMLKNKDEYTVQKYFGCSDVFTAEAIANKLTATVISFISSESKDDSFRVVIHVCTLDYTKMKDESSNIKSEINSTTQDNADSTIKKEMAKGIINGQFDIHYNIPVIIKNGTVEITESLKQAITGNWYNGVNTELTEVECPLSNK